MYRLMLHKIAKGIPDQYLTLGVQRFAIPGLFDQDNRTTQYITLPWQVDKRLKLLSELQDLDKPITPRTLQFSRLLRMKKLKPQQYTKADLQALKDLQLRQTLINNRPQGLFVGKMKKNSPTLSLAWKYTNKNMLNNLGKTV